MRNISRSGEGRSYLKWIGILAALVCVFTSNAVALTVGCSGAPAGSYDFTSLNTALGAANRNGDTITVSGVCTELVDIHGFDNLVITGTTGATLAEPLGFSPRWYVLDISGSHNLRINTLRIQARAHTQNNAITVVSVEENSDVRFASCTIEGSAWTDGIEVNPNSRVTIVGNTVIQNLPNGYGLMALGSGASLSLIQSGSPPQCPVIQNTHIGIGVFHNAHVIVFSCALIRDNSSYGLYANTGAVVDVRNPGDRPGAVQVLNSQIGLVAAQGGVLTLTGPALVQGHALAGIRLRAATGALQPAGNLGPTITQNGFGSYVCCTVNAGVSVAQNAVVDISVASISGNSAPGIYLTDNSSARLLNPTVQITGNQGGVVVQNNSVAFLASGSISGNGTDLSCTEDSRAYGDGSGVGRMNCPGFRAQSIPAMGPKEKIIP